MFDLEGLNETLGFHSSRGAVYLHVAHHSAWITKAIKSGLSIWARDLHNGTSFCVPWFQFSL